MSNADIQHELKHHILPATYTRQMKTHTLTADIDHIHGPQTPDNMACYIHTRQLQIRASTADIVTHVK